MPLMGCARERHPLTRSWPNPERDRQIPPSAPDPCTVPLISLIRLMPLMGCAARLIANVTLSPDPGPILKGIARSRHPRGPATREAASPLKLKSSHRHTVHTISTQRKR
jgi:hypothetical protein